MSSAASPIWTAKELAEFLGVSIHWVYRRSAEIPRCPGIGRFRVNVNNPDFQTWLKSKIGRTDVDSNEATQ
jgi:predicted DNA-binding transcriptional regulator AlpA